MDNLIKKINKNSVENDKIDNLKKKMETKQPIQMEKEELEFATKPIGKAHLLSQSDVKNETVIMKGKYKYIECNICGKLYCTNNSGKHRKTQYHKLHEKINNKLKKILLD